MVEGEGEVEEVEEPLSQVLQSLPLHPMTEGEMCSQLQTFN